MRTNNFENALDERIMEIRSFLITLDDIKRQLNKTTRVVVNRMHAGVCGKKDYVYTKVTNNEWIDKSRPYDSMCNTDAIVERVWCELHGIDISTKKDRKVYFVFSNVHLYDDKDLPVMEYYSWCDKDADVPRDKFPSDDKLTRIKPMSKLCVPNADKLRAKLGV